MKPHYEVVRSGRRQNFFMIENAFIDDWAKVVGLISIAVFAVFGDTRMDAIRLSSELRSSQRS